MQTQQQIQVQADQKLTVTLPALMWSQIMTIVQQAPISWERAQPIVQVLGEQLQIATENAGPMPNGLDTSPAHLPQ